MRINKFFKKLIPGWMVSKGPPAPLNGNYSMKNEIGEVIALEYQWINNEQLLREEGAVYGLLGQGLNEKLEVIQNYFNKVSSALEVHLQSEERAILVLVNQEKKIREKLEKLKYSLDNFPDKPERKLHHFWRSIAGFLIYTTIICAVFYATYLWLLPEFKEDTLWVSLGVFLFGALSLFGHFPVLLHHDQAVEEGNKREKWKLILEELGIPLVASIFIISYGAFHHPWLHSIAMALLLQFVFMFAGKGLLASITAMGPQWQFFRNNFLQSKKNQHSLNELKFEIKETENAIRIAETQISDKQVLLGTIRKALVSAQVECETRKAYFTSEYTLAKNANLRHSLFD